MDKFILNFDNYSWSGVDRVDYQSSDNEDIVTKEITVQNLVGCKFGTKLNVEYFECCKEGYLKLERHDKIAVVIIARGKGQVVIHDDINDVNPMDVIVMHVNSAHQFINIGEKPFGFFLIQTDE